MLLFQCRIHRASQLCQSRVDIFEVDAQRAPAALHQYVKGIARLRRLHQAEIRSLRFVYYGAFARPPLHLAHLENLIRKYPLHHLLRIKSSEVIPAGKRRPMANEHSPVMEE